MLPAVYVAMCMTEANACFAFNSAMGVAFAMCGYPKYFINY